MNNTGNITLRYLVSRKLFHGKSYTSIMCNGFSKVWETNIILKHLTIHYLAFEMATASKHACLEIKKQIIERVFEQRRVLLEFMAMKHILTGPR